MSKRKDRERAKNGLLFRDGKYISKEELAKAMKLASIPKTEYPEGLKVHLEK